MYKSHGHASPAHVKISQAKIRKKISPGKIEKKTRLCYLALIFCDQYVERKYQKGGLNG